MAVEEYLNEMIVHGNEVSGGTNQYKIMRPGEPVQNAAEFFMEKYWNIEKVIIVKYGDKVFGIITPKDIIRTISNCSFNRHWSVSHVTNEDVLALNENLTLQEMLKTVTKRDPALAYFVDDDGKFKGYLTPDAYKELLSVEQNRVKRK